MNNQQQYHGKIPSEIYLPEITLKAFILSIFLTILLTASTIYLGLKVGITISASIPAAVISMGILGCFQRHNILENNIVQTTASGGMSLASGVIFSLPALLILGIWEHFHYWESFWIMLYGGILGVLFAVPFRKILLSDPTLPFPEGTAIGNILQAKANNSTSFHHLLWGGLAGAVMSLGQMGLKIISEGLDLWLKIGKTVSGIGLGFSPVLLGAGFIIGGRIAFVTLYGVVLGWIIGIPVLGYFYGLPESNDIVSQVMILWSERVRYIGVGVLLVGGLWTFFFLINPLIKGVKTSRAHITALKSTQKIKRIERDIPYKLVFLSILFFVIPLFFVYKNAINLSIFEISESYGISLNIIIIIYTLVIGMILSAIIGYIVGLVGSSASPLSAIALGGILFVTLIILGFLGGYSAFGDNPEKALAASSLSIIIGVIVICACAITNDTIQDLKVGYMVGATPWKQQVMQGVGVIVAAFLIPPILELLYQAYGLGNTFPRPGMDIHASLAAPQAQLIASITKGVFSHNVPWGLLGIGAIIALINIFIEKWSKAHGFGAIPVLAIGLGIYLPISASTPLIIGGLVAFFAEKHLKAKHRGDERLPKIMAQSVQRGFILSSGIIAGGALVGIFLAIPFVIMESTDVFAILSQDLEWLASIFGIFAVIGICLWLYLVSIKEETS